MAELTRNALVRALHELLLQRTIDKITIADITKKAGVNRQTFYYHFSDIYDIVRWTSVAIWNDVMKKNGLTGIFFDEKPMNAFLDVLFEHKDTVLNIYRGMEERTIRHMLHEMLDPQISAEVTRLADGRLSSSDMDFAVAYYSACYFGVLIEWLDVGLDESYRTRMGNLMYTIKESLVLLVDRLVYDRMRKN